jgi:hypothetical protein
LVLGLNDGSFSSTRVAFLPFQTTHGGEVIWTTSLPSDGQDNRSDVAIGNLSLQTINAFSGDEFYMYYRFLSPFLIFLSIAGAHNKCTWCSMNYY